jgi:hypothetical protein
MTEIQKYNISYEQIENGALILLLLRECKTWIELSGRFENANPSELYNTTTMILSEKLFKMRDQGLISFEDETIEGNKKPKGAINDTGLWSKIRVAFGGMSLSEVTLLSRHSNGMAIKPVFGRPKQPEIKTDIFVLMPFNIEMNNIYTNHIKELGKELNLNILRADDFFSPKPFMEKVWDGICASQLVVADCTQKNPNVFYEIGIAHTVGKKVVLITRSVDDIPSDIVHFDYILYDENTPDGTKNLIEKLRIFIKNLFKM